MPTLTAPTNTNTGTPRTTEVNPRNELHTALTSIPSPMIRLELLILNAELTQFIDNHPHTNGTCTLQYHDPFTATLVKQLTQITLANTPAWQEITRTRDAITLQAGPWWTAPPY